LIRGTKWAYFDNGQKLWELYKDGKIELETYWYENGQKACEGTYKDGELMDYGLIGMKMDRRVMKDLQGWEI
jgi:antitoxin component YwqK of YwqJK toxin-antitoxin module